MREFKNRFNGVDMTDVTAVFAAGGAKESQAPYMFGRDRAAYMQGTLAAMILGIPDPMWTPALRSTICLHTAQLYHRKQEACEYIVDFIRAERQKEGYFDRLVEIETTAFSTVPVAPRAPRAPKAIEKLGLSALEEMEAKIKAAKEKLQQEGLVETPAVEETKVETPATVGEVGEWTEVNKPVAKPRRRK